MSSHMHDFDDHIRAIVADLGYWRTKRFEASVFRFARIGAVTLYDIMNAYSNIREVPDPPPVENAESETESKIRSLEIALGEYIKGVMLIETVPIEKVVIDDLRKEGGSYDKFFMIEKKSYTGPLDQKILDIQKDLKDYRTFLEAFTMALIARGLMTQEELEKKREEIKKSSIENGGRIVARAWLDPSFKAHLLADAREAVRDFGTPLSGTPNLIVVENSESVHNVVVCTLCSCYPYDLLGNPPWWYKHDSYKTAIIENPRKTLDDMFGLKIRKDVEIRVHDSTSDFRYLVLPKRPPFTEHMSEAELAKLVTSETLIGTAEALSVAK
jgi:hypothetical protein